MVEMKIIYEQLYLVNGFVYYLCIIITPVYNQFNIFHITMKVKVQRADLK